MPDLNSLLADLADEGESLDALVAPLPADRWTAPTPAAGWTVAHQISHLAWTDAQAIASATDGAAFTAELEAAMGDPQGVLDEGAAEGTRQDPADLLARWRDGRRRVVAALAAVPPGTKLPWYGPPMSAMSLATARLMETWAHGEDVAAAVGARREPTDRLRHVAHIGVRTRDFAYRNRRLAPPAEEFRVELTAPSGETWAWGPRDARQSVAGPLLDFCLLVSRRRHRDDVALTATGPDADHWLGIAQAFAGAPGADPEPAGNR